MNTVQLLGHYGGDESHALSAWTSTSRDYEKKKHRMPELLKMLAKNGHHTPFEKSSLHFLVTCDQASHIHLLKHRIGVSINAECLTGDTEITFVDINNNSSPKLRLTIEELYNKWNNGRSHQNTEKDKEYSRMRIKNRRLRVLDEKTGFFINSYIKDIWHKGKQDIFKITLEDGKIIKCTENHAIYTKDGYKTISNGLSIKDLVGVNGIHVSGNGFYRDYDLMKKFREQGMSVKQMAEKCECSYHTIRKWLKIHNLKFQPNERNFKKGNKPWNKGFTGYSINISDSGLRNRIKNIKKGKDSHFWRGGISDDRSLIGAWTTNNARKVHQKYNFTCQKCGNGSSRLHAHHIIPVSTDKTKAYDFDNLITVCQNCHQKIHYSNETEIEFAEYVLSDNFKYLKKKWGKNKKKRIGNKLKVHFSKVLSIEYLGKQTTYDIEVDGDNNNFIANGIVVHNSARYKMIKEQETHVPADWPEKWKQKLLNQSQITTALYYECLEELTPLLGRQRAKESARYFKMFNSQITMDVMFNFRSFYHFQKLRNDQHAQKEIREIAQTMLEQVKNLPNNPFEFTIKAFEL